jgi:hypothetical protein
VGGGGFVLTSGGGERLLASGAARFAVSGFVLRAALCCRTSMRALRDLVAWRVGGATCIRGRAHSLDPLASGPDPACSAPGTPRLL